MWLVPPEFPRVLTVKGPWDPQFQIVVGPFCFSGVLCLLLKLRPARTCFQPRFRGNLCFQDGGWALRFSCVPGMHIICQKNCVLFIFCVYKTHICALMGTLLTSPQYMGRTLYSYKGLCIHCRPMILSRLDCNNEAHK